LRDTALNFDLDVSLGRRAKEPELENLFKVLTIDSKILNFQTCLPTKILASSVTVTNKSQYEQIIELAVDNISFVYNKDDINSRFLQPTAHFPQKEEIPFTLEKNQHVNSEMKYELWWIENPISKELTKRITIKLGPKSIQEFIIVIKSPNVKKPENLLSTINIGLLTLP
jgi:hypothetical protein